jgi:hypothetical protein
VVPGDGNRWQRWLVEDRGVNGDKTLDAALGENLRVRLQEFRVVMMNNGEEEIVLAREVIFDAAITPTVKVRRTRNVRAKKLGRYFNSLAVSKIRALVCAGIDRAAGELFKVAETVPGVRPRRSATDLSVTLFCSLAGLGFFFSGGVIRTASTIR